ncbi:MAG: methyl-accepting chemotaxis protein [Bacillota bacterium]
MKSIKTIFITISLLITVIIFAAQTGFGFYQFKAIVSKEVEAGLKLQAEKEALLLSERISDVGKNSVSFAKNIEGLSNYNANLLLDQIKPYIKDNKLVYGGGFWFEPYMFDKGKKYFGPYVYKENNETKLTWDYSNAEYDYFKWDWYKNGMNARNGIGWTGPYYDDVSKVTMITAASPIQKDGKVIGVTTCDIIIDELSEYVKNQIKVGENGYAFIVTPDGFYMAHREAEKNFKIKITEDEQAGELGNTIIKAVQPEIEKTTLSGVDYYVSYSPIGNTGMKLVTALPVSETTGPINQYFIRNSISFLISIVVFGILLFLLIHKKVTQPLYALYKNANQVSQGDLTYDDEIIKNNSSKSEIGHLSKAFNFMIQNMNDLVREISKKSRLVTEAAQHLNANADQTTANASQTAATMTEIASTVDTVASNIQEISKASEVTTKLAMEGNEGIASVTHQMKNIAASTREAAEVINGLSNKSQEITQILELINGIAEQTNLLALNAAIEAARAGEQGRGFAVVAEEVRKLAEQTASATKEINNLINAVQLESQRAVATMAEGVEKVETGTNVVNSVGANFREIIGAVQGFSEQIEQVAVATTEMSSGITNIAASIEEQTASNEEVLSAAESLSALAGELNEAIRKFKV